MRKTKASQETENRKIYWKLKEKEAFHLTVLKEDLNKNPMLWSTWIL